DGHEGFVPDLVEHAHGRLAGVARAQLREPFPVAPGGRGGDLRRAGQAAEALDGVADVVESLGGFDMDRDPEPLQRGDMAWRVAGPPGDGQVRAQGEDALDVEGMAVADAGDRAGGLRMVAPGAGPHDPVARARREK